MSTVLIIAFICATKLGFLLWFYKNAREYYSAWAVRKDPLKGYPITYHLPEPICIAIDACIAVAGWAWVLGSGIA